MVPVGGMGFFVTCGLGWPRFPRFILLGSGALLVVSALGIVYDWHL